jgi:predicted MFS family arabinose efflux permease
MSGPAGPEFSEAERAPETRLLNRGFVLLSLAMFLVFCNMAVFFEFYGYLKTLKIPQASLGLIIGVFSLTALIIRPFISLALNPSNAKPWFVAGAVGAVTALLLYGQATTAGSLILVRVLHGGFYVLMAASCVAALVGCIDKKHSGQAFGLLAVITIVPYAVVPPVAEALRKMVPDYPDLLAVTGLALLLVIPLVLLVPPSKSANAQAASKIGWQEAKDCLKDGRLVVLLLSAFLLYMPFTAIFYFINSFADSLKIADAGLFFTVATGTEIGVRIVFGRYFDLLPKSRLLAGAMLLLAAAYYVLTLVSTVSSLLLLAVAFGLGWGFAMPMVNALLFDISKPTMRAFITNLGYEVFQGGFFLGPFAGAWLLHTFGYGGLFSACAGACLAGAALMLLFENDGFMRQKGADQP